MGLLKNNFSQAALRTKEYVFAFLAKKKKEYETSSGNAVLNLAPGVPFYPPSEHYVEKLKEFIDAESFQNYPGYSPQPYFVKALKNWYKRRFQIAEKTLENLDLTIAQGGKDVLSHFALIIGEKGDEILFPNPGYPGAFGALTYYGIKPVFYSLDEKNNYYPDFDQLTQLLTARTKALVVNFPSNPTSTLADISLLKKLVEFCLEKQIWLIYDNAYSEIYFSQRKPRSIFEVKGAEKVAVEIGSFSKTFSFAGLRLGWIIGNKEFLNKYITLRSQLDSGISLHLQKLAAYALENFDYHWWKEMIQVYKQRRDQAISFFKSKGFEFNTPESTFYIWAKYPSRLSSVDFVLDFMQKENILLAPGTAFGNKGEGYVRISFPAFLK